MQFKNGLTFFARTNSPGCLNVASWHSRHSLTWRWILSVNLPRRGEGRWRPIWHWSPHNCGGQAYFGFLKFGVRWHWQHPMWYRDLYHRMRDEQEVAAGRLYRGSAYKPPPPIPPIMPEQTSTRH
jgi:hypothetical protein